MFIISHLTLVILHYAINKLEAD